MEFRDLKEMSMFSWTTSSTTGVDSLVDAMAGAGTFCDLLDMRRPAFTNEANGFSKFVGMTEGAARGTARMPCEVVGTGSPGTGRVSPRDWLCGERGLGICKKGRRVGIGIDGRKSRVMVTSLLIRDTGLMDGQTCLG